jgi:ankyrin repeat protein
MITKQILILSAFMISLANTIGLKPSTINDELFAAVRSKTVYKVEELLAQGANPNARDKNGNTPLHLLPFSQRIADSGGADADIALLLLQFGADPNAQNNKGNTPTHTSACNISVLRLLDARNANFSIKNKNNKTPLDSTDWYKNNPLCPGRSLLEEYQRIYDELHTLKNQNMNYYKEKENLNKKI